VGFLINAALAVVAGWLLFRSLWRNLRLSWLIAFLAVDLIAYPLTDLLIVRGWYPVGSPAVSLLGSAMAATLHYVPLLGMILWLSLAKDTKAYFSGKSDC